jgi:hypothetical protein
MHDRGKYRPPMTLNEAIRIIDAEMVRPVAGTGVPLVAEVGSGRTYGEAQMNAPKRSPISSGTPTTQPLPFTEASLARAIRGVERAGRYVVGVKGDGTILVSLKPLDTVSLAPEIEQDVPASKWEDQRV